MTTNPVSALRAAFPSPRKSIQAAGARWCQACGMKRPELRSVDARAMWIRRARFEDVSEILRLIERSLEHGCRDVYDARQRRAVFLGYASSLFVEALAPYETLAATSGDRLVGAAQIDPRSGLLRALFVDAGCERRGVGRALLAAVESRARAAGCTRVGGAMSLNAVEFYRRAGFRSRGRPRALHEGPVLVPVQWMEKPLGSAR
jgi:GNAT superfamily N-acetyltransferase